MFKQNYIFLDIDGVLNTNETKTLAPSGYKGIENKYIEKLKKIVNKLNAKIILISDWKEDWADHYEKCGEDIKYIIDKLNNYNIKIVDATTDTKGTYYRGQGILDWLEKHIEVNEYIILDDNEYDYYAHPEIRKHLITTIDALDEVEPYIAIESTVLDIVDFINEL